MDWFTLYILTYFITRFGTGYYLHWLNYRPNIVRNVTGARAERVAERDELPQDKRDKKSAS